MGKFERLNKKRKFENHNKGHPKRPRGEFNLGPRLSEIDVGVSEYVSDYPGFGGIIKQRFSDFLVNEIDPENEEVHLTEVNPVVSDEPPSANVDLAFPEDFTEAISKKDWDALKELADTKDGSVDIDVTEKSKDERRQIHEAIKKIYKSDFTANTTEIEGKKVISVSFKPDSRRSLYSKENRFTHFTMYKENFDSMDAVNILAQKLHVRPACITYAGTKDKRAKTSQRLSMKNTKPSQIARASKSLRGIFLGNYKFCAQPLKLGSLNGNRFQIVLRNVLGSDEQIELSMQSLQEKGFLNYFGLQRFGTHSVPTYHIGKALICGNWQEAVDLILKPRDGEDVSNFATARKIWWETKDAGEALKHVRGRSTLEGHLLKGLANNHKNDLVNALEAVPRNMRLLYLHSYQSYIWNHVLSRRIKEFGFKPAVGDLVLAEGSKLEEIVEEVTTEEAADSSAGASTSNEQSKLPAVTVLTAESIDKYSVHDLILPLPGFNVKYPENESLEWFKEMLAKDGLTLDSLKQNVKKYSLGGAYRKMSILPTKVSWRIAKYDDATVPLVLSDMDIIEKKGITNCPEGKMKALVMDFCLPSSVYATMALREVLKEDTSSHHQKSLNPPKEEDNKDKEVSSLQVEAQAAG